MTLFPKPREIMVGEGSAMKSHSRLLLFFILILLLLPYAVSGQSDEEMAWTQPTFMGPGWFPSLTIDATDTVHLIWSGGSTSVNRGERFGNEELIDSLIYAKIPPVGTPNPFVDVVVAGEGGYTVRNAIDVDSEGTLHTLFRTYVQHDYVQAPSNVADDAWQWINQVTLSSDSSYYLDLLVDSNDIIHTVSSVQSTNLKKLNLEIEGNVSSELLEEYPCLFCSDLIYRRSADGGRTWSSFVNLSDTFEGSERQDIFEGADGRIYISWSEGFDWVINDGQSVDVRFVYSDDQGLTWSEPIILDGGDAPDKSPTQFELTEFGEGALMGIWRYNQDRDNRIYFQISTDSGQSWAEPQPVPYLLATGYNSLDKYELLTDYQGIIHLFAVGYDEATQIGPAVYHMEYRQGRWLRPVRLFYDPDIDQPEYIQAEVGPLNDLAVTWFTRKRRTSDDTGDLNVYFTRRSGNLASEVLLAEYPPTVTPWIAPTVVPTFEPTATLLPTLASLEESMDVVQRNRDQNATQTLLGAVFAVSILCVGVLVLSGFRPRL